MRRRAVCGVLLVLCGCRQLLGFEQPTSPDAALDDAAIDTASDAAVDSVDACVSFSTQLDTCTLAFGPSLDLTGMNVYDTDSGTLTTPGGPITPTHVVVTGPAGAFDAIVVVGFSLAQTASLRAVGSRPLAIVVSGDIIVGGTLDLTAGGAGSNPASCGTRRGGDGVNDTGGGGGGGGGGFAGGGGSGGKGDADGGTSNGGQGGGVTLRPPGLVGGCGGGVGGTAVDMGGNGGPGAGAIGLVAATRITVDGIINAGGGRGRGALAGSGGGGGGGSGGMVVLESPAVQLAASAILSANGGGGGEGSDATSTGANGQIGQASSVAATGGANGAANGADGGSGSAGTQLFGVTPAQLKIGGGGGGGGGAGFIAITGMQPAPATISPSAQSWP